MNAKSTLKNNLVLTGLALLIVMIPLGFVSLYFHWRLMFKIIQIISIIAGFTAVVYNSKSWLRKRSQSH